MRLFYLSKNIIPHTIPHRPDKNQGKNVKIMSNKKTRSPKGENRSPDDLQVLEKTGFRLSPE
jgi:hypothetical protein